MRKKIKDFEVLDHGVDSSDYFQGCGVSNTAYDQSATGRGHSLKEALSDALDQLSDEFVIPAPLYAEIDSSSEEDAVTPVIESDLPAAKWIVSHQSIAIGEPLMKETFYDEADAMERIECMLESLRKSGFIISAHHDDQYWEVCEPDDCAMIPDEVGGIFLHDNHEEIDELREKAQDQSRIGYFATIRIAVQE